MKIVVMGAGGVGGYFGGRLAQAGHEVSFVARGKHLEAIKAKGLALKSPVGDALLKVKAAVITSYSIHYTKLYDARLREEGLRAMKRPRLGGALGPSSTGSA